MLHYVYQKIAYEIVYKLLETIYFREFIEGLIKKTQPRLYGHV